MINAIVPWGEVHVPNGFGLSDEGLFAYNKKTKDYGYVCPPLAFVSGTSSLSDGSETYDLQYVTSRGDVVVREVRAAELTSRDIESWVGFGIGVTPTNKVPLLRFLVAQRRCIDIKVTYATVGWLNDDEFAANQLISSDPQRAGSLDSGSYDLQPKGTAHEWWKMWSGIRQNAALQLAVAVGLSSVLLRPISQAYPDLRNLLVSFIGNSSTGKTTAAMLAVSVAGNTQPFSQGSLMRSWSATPTAIPIMLDGNHGVPFVLDELSRFKGRDLTDVLYNLAEGTSRVRATKIATLRETSSWQTTIVVTGEHGLLDGTVSAQNDGLRTRVIELESVQWTSSSEEAEFIKTNCSNAYGWLITDLVKWVIFHREELLETFEAAVLMAKRLMADAPYRDRLSIKYAVLGATAVAANKCWPEIGLDAEKIMELAIQHSRRNWSTDLAGRVYMDLIDYLKANQASLLLPNSQYANTKVIGKISMVSNSMFIDLFPREFKKIVTEDLGAQSDRVVLSEFRKRGYLRNEADRQTTRITISGKRRTVVSIKIPEADQCDFTQSQRFDGEGLTKEPFSSGHIKTINDAVLQAMKVEGPVEEPDDRELDAIIDGGDEENE